MIDAHWPGNIHIKIKRLKCRENRVSSDITDELTYIWNHRVASLFQKKLIVFIALKSELIVKGEILLQFKQVWKHP